MRSQRLVANAPKKQASTGPQDRQQTEHIMQDSLSVYIPNSSIETKIGNKAHLGGMEGVRKDPRRLKAGDN